MSRSTPSVAPPLGVAVATVLFLLLGIGALGIIGDGAADSSYLAVIAFTAWLYSRVAHRQRPSLTSHRA